MTDLSRDLREQLAERYRIGLPEIAERRQAGDGTCKYLFRLPDAATIEAVVKNPKAGNLGAIG